MYTSKNALVGAAMVAMLLLSGCITTTNGVKVVDIETGEPIDAVGSTVDIEPVAVLTSPDSARFSAPPDPDFTSLSGELLVAARQLEAVAISQSPARQDLRAAMAQLSATGFGGLPQIAPSASVPFGGSANAGISVEQMIWDGGRQKAQMTASELSVVEATLNYWQERNDYTAAGLSHLVEVSQYRRRMQVYRELQDELTRLDAMLETRAAGGVADRGERLRMSVAVQEIRREMVDDEAKLAQAVSSLNRLRRTPGADVKNIDIDTVSQFCSRSWPQTEPPVVALARIFQGQTENSERLTEARKYPKVNIGTGISILGGFSAGLSLDTTDMLGLDRNAAIARAQAQTEGSRVLYVRSVDDIASELDRLESDYRNQIANISQLSELASASNETIDLYKNQVEIGTIGITDGISIYGEHANVKHDLLDLKAEIINNCISSSRLRGTIAALGGANE